MAFTLIWSPISRDDLHDIVRYISRDNPPRAQSFALQLIGRVDVLRKQPESGRIVPEYRMPHIREVIFRPYRIIHRVDHGQKMIEIVRVWHAARGIPPIP